MKLNITSCRGTEIDKMAILNIVSERQPLMWYHIKRWPSFMIVQKVKRNVGRQNFNLQQGVAMVG